MARSHRRFAVVFSLTLVAYVSAAASAAEPVSWRPQPDFFQFTQGYEFGACSAVAVNSRGEIFVFHRGDHPIRVYDSAGKLLRFWGEGIIGSAHGLRIDKDDNVWVTDIGHHRVMKFSREGELLMSLGTGKPSNAGDAFNKPTDVAFGPKGEFYVTDGYGNTRVLKFSPSGALVHQWGSAGKGDGEFNTPHAIVIDRQGRLVVGDRENNRIQIFDADGKHLATWPGFAPYGLALDGEGRLFVADGRAHQVLELDAEGKVVGRFGREGTGAGEFSLPHMLSFDAAGNLFVTEITGKRVQKLVRQAAK